MVMVNNIYLFNFFFNYISGDFLLENVLLMEIKKKFKNGFRSQKYLF